MVTDHAVVDKGSDSRRSTGTPPVLTVDVSAEQVSASPSLLDASVVHDDICHITDVMNVRNNRKRLKTTRFMATKIFKKVHSKKVTKVRTYTMHTQKISNMLVVNISQKVRLQLTFERVETQLWVTKTVRQRIPSRRARNSRKL